jgi:light-regulated signal transduction histidine kinase (bacteriophytochrome)
MAQSRLKGCCSLAIIGREQILSASNLQQFAYVASHDFQEPLGAVGGFLPLILSKNKGRFDTETEGWINYAVDGAQRMRTLINDLLSYARVESQGEELEIIDCNAALQLAEKNLSLLLSESATNLMACELLHVMGLQGQLAQVFQNLISNAVKYRGPENPNIAMRVVEKHSDWIFSVQDNGIGFEEEYAKRIFVIFQRLHGRDEY